MKLFTLEVHNTILQMLYTGDQKHFQIKQGFSQLSSKGLDFISVFCIIPYGDEYVVHNSHVMTLIENHLQIWLKGFTEILIWSGVCV